MQILAQAADLSTGGRRVCAAIGFFDGVHLGHQQVVRQTLADARQAGGLAVVVTFDRHPASVVAPERAPALIYTRDQRLAAMASLGVDAVLMLPFTAELSAIAGDVFIRALVRDLGGVDSLCVGRNFSFGHRRSGNTDLLQRLGAELGFRVHALEAVAVGNLPVSSTRIREAIQAGDLSLAGQLLGRDYILAGEVVRGQQLGRQLGFPTANVEVRGRVTPPVGVYAAHAFVGGQRWRAAVNIGFRPTLGEAGSACRVEAHLLDHTGDLYGQVLELKFVERLRGEQRFSSLADLQGQIERDVAAARQTLAQF